MIAGVSMSASSVHAQTTPLRIGMLEYGSLQWVLDVAQRHDLDKEHGITFSITKLASIEACRTALLANSVDIILSDWFFAATQRAYGVPLKFLPFSSASGSIFASAPIDHAYGLKGKTLGVAGNEIDKSWLIVRASLLKSGFDIAKEATVSYASPPILSALLENGKLNAVLTYWNFCPELEALGYRNLLDVRTAARHVGLSNGFALTGFVFHEPWAEQNKGTVSAFSECVAAACAKLKEDKVWNEVKPLVSKVTQTEFSLLKRRFLDGIKTSRKDENENDARILSEIVQRLNGTSGPVIDGVFW
jgi:NitT/TauT family transport system substrate-binding protein